MMNKSVQNHQVKEKSGFWLLNPASKIESILLALLFIFLPTQLGKHFWPDFSIVSGIRIDYLSPTLYVTDLILGILILFAFSRIGFSSVVFLFKKYIVFFLILAFFLETALFGVRPLLGLYIWFKLCLISLFAFYIAHTIKIFSQIYLIAIFFSVNVFFESLLAILQYLNQSSLNGWLYYLGERTFNGTTPGIANASIDGMLILRPYGTFSHPNVLAGYLLITSIFIFFILVRKSTRFIKYYAIGVLIISSIAILLTLSRIVILLLFILICSLLLIFILKKQTLKTAIIITAIGGTIVSVLLLPFLKILLTRFTETSFFEEAISQRTELLVSAFAIIQKYPITGVGLGNFIPVVDTYQSPLSLGLYLQPVHNIYVLICTETGILGLSLFLWFLIRTFVKLSKDMKNILLVRKVYGVFTLMLCSILFIGLFDHYFLTLQQGLLLFAFVIGLCWSSIRHNQLSKIIV